jgi:ureidoglycolate dehydrogenase (NAD+)
VFLVAIDPAHFGDRDGYLAIVDQTLTGLKTVRPSDGVAEVLVPGEPEVRSRHHRAKLGVALADQTRAELQEIGQRFRLQFPKWRQS